MVSTFADVVAADDLTSLREAIAQAATAAGAETIQLPAGEYDLSLGQLKINDASGELTIKGINGVAKIDAQGASRVFEVAAGTAAELRNLTLTGGLDVSGATGGLYNFGTLSLKTAPSAGTYPGSMEAGFPTGA